MDAASDIDLVMAVETKTCGIQIRTWICRDIEILYVSLESLAAPRPTRSTLLGATLLYDAQDRLAPLVRQWEAHFAERQTPPAEREYGHREIAHALTVIEHIAACAPRAPSCMSATSGYPDVAGHLFDLHATGRQRQLTRLETWCPGIVTDLEGLLAPHQPNDGFPTPAFNRWKRPSFMRGRSNRDELSPCVLERLVLRKSASCTMSVCRV